MAKPILLDDMPHMAEARSIEDDWAGVSDFAARKKRQNRLNQRALSGCHCDHPTRKDKAHGGIGRRREAMKSAYLQHELTETIRPHNMERQAEFVGHLSSHTTWMPSQQAVVGQLEDRPSPVSRMLGGRPPPDFGWISGEEGALLVVSVGPTTIVLNLDSFPLPADHLLTLVRYNLYRACAANAKILGLDPRSLHDDITSPFCDLKPFNYPLPKSLVPTDTQIGVRHHPYIDIFPFGCLRDKLILLGGTIDEDELCADLGGKSSTAEHTGLIMWGDPWDPMAWELSEYVAIKWARLLNGCDKLLIATDYWRTRRGEPPLMAALS
ncbi:hypothetical protein CIB48_g5330 [Xylaria polymorpha]|nr:hypothetical protein CIB48_g5330 [Xylaria polymorpha]